jgi:hypothetical protein
MPPDNEYACSSSSSSHTEKRATEHVNTRISRQTTSKLSLGGIPKCDTVILDSVALGISSYPSHWQSRQYRALEDICHLPVGLWTIESLEVLQDENEARPW